MNQLTSEQIYEAGYNAMYAHFHGMMEIRAADYNPMFGPLETWLTRFIRPAGKEKWTCAACEKKRGVEWFWTQLIPFRAATTEHGFSLTFGPLLDALTPVCADHVLQPWHQLDQERDAPATD